MHHVRIRAASARYTSSILRMRERQVRRVWERVGRERAVRTGLDRIS